MEQTGLLLPLALRAGHDGRAGGIYCDESSFVRGLCLPRRPDESHKGDYGKILVLGGSVGYSGAPTLCAKAAVRSGAGLVWLGVPAEIYAVTAAKNDEVMPFPLPSAQGKLSPQALDALDERMAQAEVVVAGPGLGRGEGTGALTEYLLNSDKPLVLDADCLWALAEQREHLRARKALTVLTPHEGEFERLYPQCSGARQTDALAFSRAYGCVLLLKGHRSLVAFPDGRCYTVGAGNAGMATGGSGDVLAGVLGAMLGQFWGDAALLAGAWLHARAGDLAAAALGEYAMAASDILFYLAEASRENCEE